MYLYSHPGHDSARARHALRPDHGPAGPRRAAARSATIIYKYTYDDSIYDITLGLSLLLALLLAIVLLLLLLLLL